MKIIKTALQGMTMGAIDIVPGVSGSTVAVLFGIYERFIAGLKNLDLELIKALCGPIRHGFSKASRQRCTQVWRDKDMPWLVNLVVGLGCAMAAASFFIPWLMDHYPDITRGFFFGLVLGSAITPILKLKRPKLHECLIAIAFGAVLFFILGQHFQPPTNYVEVIAPANATFTQVAGTLPSLMTPDEIAALPQNEPLRQAIPDLASLTPSELASYKIPQGTSVFLPVMPYWFSFVAGFCAICAMLLPGISGSFILLVLGVYYCTLNAAKGTISSLVHASFSAPHAITIALVALGAVAGMAIFSRLLTWLFKTHPRPTYAAIVGILLGCLRAVWPFRQTVQDQTINVLPNLSYPNLPFILLATLIALAFVACALYFQKKADHNKAD